MDYQNKKEGLVIPHNSRVLRDNFKHVGNVVNLNNDDKWHITLFEKLPKNVLHAQYNLVYPGGKFSHINQKIFFTEEDI